MNFKPTATVGPTITGAPSTVDGRDIDKIIALQQFADKLRNEKFLAKKRMMQQNMNGDCNLPATSSPVRCTFVKASKALTDFSPSCRGLNIDAPSFVPFNYSTPPSTPISYVENPTPTDRPNYSDLARHQQFRDPRTVANRSFSTSDVDEYEKNNTTKDFDTSNGCNSSKRVFYSSNGSAITTPESVGSDPESNENGSEFQEPSYVPRTTAWKSFPPKRPQFENSNDNRYDRVEMLQMKDGFGTHIAVGVLRQRLSDEFLNGNGVWSPDLWIKSVWRREAELAGANSEEEYFRTRMPSKTTWGNGAPMPAFIRRSASLR